MVLMAGIAAACASDGRELAQPASWQTTTTRPLPPTSAPPAQAAQTGIELTSPDFEPGAMGPIDATCAGANVAPTLEWGPVGDDIAELALALSDQTDPENPVLLWLVTSISTTERTIVNGQLPVGARATLNDYGRSGYGNPCLETLPAGTRDLQFRLYLLRDTANLGQDAPGNTSWNTVAALAVDSASLLMQIQAEGAG